MFSRHWPDRSFNPGNNVAKYVKAPCLPYEQAEDMMRAETINPGRDRGFYAFMAILFAVTAIAGFTRILLPFLLVPGPAHR